MSFTITGTLIEKYDTQVITDKFQKREFVLELKDNNYTQYAKLQLVQAKCNLIDGFNKGQELKVSFDVRGSRSDKNGNVNYYTNLDAWRIEAAGTSDAPANSSAGFGDAPAATPPDFFADADPNDSGLPF
jgi:single-strand DNA-binding protein